MLRFTRELRYSNGTATPARQMRRRDGLSGFRDQATTALNRVALTVANPQGFDMPPTIGTKCTEGRTWQCNCAANAPGYIRASIASGGVGNIGRIALCNSENERFQYMSSVPRTRTKTTAAIAHGSCALNPAVAIPPVAAKVLPALRAYAISARSNKS